MADDSQASIRKAPCEVRLMIWGHLLELGPIHVDDDLKNDGIVPGWPVDGMGKETKPFLPIFRLAKTFVAELEHVLYSRNTYILTSETSIERFLRILQMNGKDRRPLLQYIQIGLGFHDICPTKDARIVLQTDIDMFNSDVLLDGDGNNVGQEQPYPFWSHRVRKDRFRKHSWPRKLRQVAAELNPRHLTLDLRQAYCQPARCCPMETTALMQLKDVRFKQGVPELHVLGLWGFTDSLSLTIGDTLVRSLWRSWIEPDSADTHCIEADGKVKEEMEKEMKNDGTVDGRGN